MADFKNNTDYLDAVRSPQRDAEAVAQSASDLMDAKLKAQTEYIIAAVNKLIDVKMALLMRRLMQSTLGDDASHAADAEIQQEIRELLDTYGINVPFDEV